MVPIEENLVELRKKEIMKEIMRLIPCQSKDKIDALKEIVWYLGAILLGDNIHQYATYNYHTKYAQEAIDTLIDYAQEHSIEDYKETIEKLKARIDSLEKYELELEQKITILSSGLSGVGNSKVIIIKSDNEYDKTTDPNPLKRTRKMNYMDL